MVLQASLLLRTYLDLTTLQDNLLQLCFKILASQSVKN